MINTEMTILPNSYDTSKPLFVYGTLMPGEIAHDQISDFISSYEPAKLPGFVLGIRDLMPLVDISDSKNAVEGFILHPKPETSTEFYAKLLKFEGVNFELVNCHCEISNSMLIDALVFKGVATDYGRPEIFKGTKWSTKLDPLLSKSFPVLIQDIQEVIQLGSTDIQEVIQLGSTDIQEVIQLGSTDFQLRQNDWKLKNRKISNFLLLSSILEHIWSLTYGALFTGEKGEINNLLKSMASSPAYKSAYKSASGLNLIPCVSIRDSRDVRRRPISTEKDSSALRTWYRIRGNSLHRGKSGSDTEIVENALIGLGNLLLIYLESQVPGIREEWDNKVPNLGPITR